MYSQNYLLEALETVLAWDLSEDILPAALNDQMLLLAGFDAEADWE